MFPNVIQIFFEDDEDDEVYIIWDLQWPYEGKKPWTICSFDDNQIRISLPIEITRIQVGSWHWTKRYIIFFKKINNTLLN
jgi:hypothetical protein